MSDLFSINPQEKYVLIIFVNVKDTYKYGLYKEAQRRFLILNHLCAIILGFMSHVRIYIYWI